METSRFRTSIKRNITHNIPRHHPPASPPSITYTVTMMCHPERRRSQSRRTCVCRCFCCCCRCLSCLSSRRDLLLSLHLPLLSLPTLTDNRPHFHNKGVISRKKQLPQLMLFKQITSIFQLNGGEIFQQERADKGHQENRQRDSRSIQETGSFGWNRESSCSECNDRKVREARAPLAGTKQF